MIFKKVLFDDFHSMLLSSLDKEHTLFIAKTTSATSFYILVLSDLTSSNQALFTFHNRTSIFNSIGTKATKNKRGKQPRLLQKYCLFRNMYHQNTDRQTSVNGNISTDYFFLLVSNLRLS